MPGLRDNDDNFKSVYAAIGSQLEAIAGYPFDRQCNNFSRLMVLAHDPDLRVRDDAEPFQAEALLSGGSSVAMTSLAASDEVARYVAVAEANLNLSEGNRHSALVSLASCMNRKGFPEEKVIPVLVGRYAQAGFGEREIVSTIRDVYRRYAVDFGVNRKNPEKKEDAKVQKVQKVQKVHSAPDAETYMQAVACERPLVESFREQLPHLLQDAIDESQSPDVQWAMLLAVCRSIQPCRLMCILWKKTSVICLSVVFGLVNRLPAKDASKWQLIFIACLPKR